MSAEILEKAGELAEAIAASEELSALRDTEVAMKEDPEAMVIVDEFQGKQQELYGMQMRGEAVSDNAKKEVEIIEGKMSNNPTIKAYLDASEKFELLMRSVNLVITSALSGNDDGCGGECGPSCGCDCGGGCN